MKVLTPGGLATERASALVMTLVTRNSHSGGSGTVLYGNKRSERWYVSREPAAVSGGRTLLVWVWKLTMKVPCGLKQGRKG